MPLFGASPAPGMPSALGSAAHTQVLRSAVCCSGNAGLLYLDGVDALGRPVVVINADAVPHNMRHSALVYCKMHLEPVVNKVGGGHPFFGGSAFVVWWAGWSGGHHPLTWIGGMGYTDGCRWAMLGAHGVCGSRQRRRGRAGVREVRRRPRT